MGDCTKLYGPPRRPVPPMKTTRRDSSQLQAYLGFPSASPQNLNLQDPQELKCALTNVCPVFIVCHLYNHVILPAMGYFQQLSSPRVSSEATRDCSIFIFISKQQQANQIGLAWRCVMHRLFRELGLKGLALIGQCRSFNIPLNRINVQICIGGILGVLTVMILKSMKGAIGTQ